jgi:hypothetical protein
MCSMYPPGRAVIIKRNLGRDPARRSPYQRPIF